MLSTGLFEVFYRGILIGTCTEDYRQEMLNEAVYQGVINEEVDHSFVEFRRVGVINKLLRNTNVQNKKNC